MYQVMRNVRHEVNEAIDRIRSHLPLNAMQLLWGLGAVSLLLPAVAYAWWRHNPVASSLTSNNQSSSTANLKLSQPAPAKIDTHFESSNTASGDTSQKTNSDNGATHAQLHVNGQSVPLPSQGTVHKEITSKDGKTTVDISVNSNSSGTSQSTTSTNIELNSSTNSSTESSSASSGDVK